MTKPSSYFVCQNCGATSNKWTGKCDACQEWNSFVEEIKENKPNSPLNTINYAASIGNLLECNWLDQPVFDNTIQRYPTFINELDRVLGGGLVAGSVILLGGEPGIGKSTLLLQMAAALINNNQACLYVSGEESVNQLQIRAQRLGLSGTKLKIITTTNVNDAISTFLAENCNFVIIDSIQTMTTPLIGSSAGTVGQIRACASMLINTAKDKNVVIILVGHVTKDGQIAGPKLLEHMVDAVLYFENETSQEFRIIRSTKNRYGAVNEIGVFEMCDNGLQEITNPSSRFVHEHGQLVSGVSVFAALEGTRPILIEVQALVSPTNMIPPRRAVVGWDTNRLAMLLAVLSTRCGVRLSDKEVYLTVAGGLKIYEPGMDLAAAAALISATKNISIPSKTIFIGEIGLSGEVRSVSNLDLRLNEAEKLGYEIVYIPYNSKIAKHNIQLRKIQHVKEIVEIFTSKAKA